MKLLHTADLHLDTPFSLLDPEQSDRTLSQIRTTFSAMVQYVESQKVDLFFIAGDLFNNTFASHETAAFLCREFASAPSCRFVIAPGNHDCYSEYSVYAKTEWPENVYIFKEPRLSCFTFDDLGVNVWGFAWDGPTFQKRILEGFSLPGSTGINLFCGHCELTDRQSDNAPISKEEIEASGFAYMALGHSHNSDGVKRIGSTCYGYAGVPVGRNYSETGSKGVLTAELENKSDGKDPISAIRRLRFSKHHFENDTLDVTGARDTAEVAARIRAHIEDRKYEKDTSLRLTLTGELSPEVLLSEEQLRGAADAVDTWECRIETRSRADGSALRRDPTIRGAYFDEFRSGAAGTDQHSPAVLADALRLGLHALDASN